MCQNTHAGGDGTGVLAHAVERDVAAVSATHHQDTQIIRTVTFDFCSDPHCSCTSDSASTVHLLISHSDILITEVGKNRLKAISYAWGGFERTNRLIGHDVYKMVTDALGVDHEICRSRGLRLMVSRDPPCLGLADRAFPSRYAGIRAGLIPSDSLKTVCMTHGQAVHGSVLYEVEKVDGLGIPRYRVFSVWVPMRGACLDAMYAIAEHGATDAYIV